MQTHATALQTAYTADNKHVPDFTENVKRSEKISMIGGISTSTGKHREGGMGITR